MKKGLDFWFECVYPAVFAVLLGVATGVVMKKCGVICVNTFSTVMDDVIGVASILIGLLGALVGIVFSLADNNVMKSVMRAIKLRTLRIYIEEPIVVGVLVIVLTIVYRIFSPCTVWQQASYLAVTLWLLLSFARVISILLKQCFIIIKPKNTKFFEDYSREERAQLTERLEKNPIDKSEEK